jgi:aromatic ring-opening dioxygenase catalytic subunit (LigB family)
MKNYITADGPTEPPPDDRVPALFLSSAPEDIEGLVAYAEALSRLNEQFDVKGIVLVCAHWIRPGTSRNVLVDVTGGFPAELRKPAKGHFALAERIGQLLALRGVICDIEEQGSHNEYCESLLGIFEAGRSRPIVRVSVPLNYGPDLMVLTGVSLAPLRDERVLVAACGESMGPRLRERAAAGDFATVKRFASSAPQSRTARVFPVLFVMAAARDGDRLYPVLDGAPSPILALGAPRREQSIAAPAEIDSLTKVNA